VRPIAVATCDLDAGLHPELVTARVVEWSAAADALAGHTHKTVVVRSEQ
jgi:hypothetical protein